LLVRRKLKSMEVITGFCSRFFHSWKSVAFLALILFIFSFPVMHRIKYPPLPVVSEIVSIPRFFLAGQTDDFVEDTTKLACLLGAGSFVNGVANKLSLVDGSSTALHVLGMGVFYKPCDFVGDLFGDIANNAMDKVLLWLGFDIELEENSGIPPGNEPAPVLHVIDDIVEDGFKFVCVWSYFQVGKLYGKNLLTVLLPYPGFEQVNLIIGDVIKLGVPIKKYAMCNNYADFLGDLSQLKYYLYLYPQHTINASYASNTTESPDDSFSDATE